MKEVCPGAHRLTIAWRVSLGGRPIDCERYGRAGSYGRDGLVARFGAVTALPDLLMTLATTCELRRDFSRACGARFTDLAAKRE